MKKAASIFLRANMGQADIYRLSDWMENREITRFLNEDADSPRALRRLVETTPEPMLAYRFNQRGRFFLVCDDEEDSIGFVRLSRQETPDCYEIVFAIGEEELWGTGYGTQAVRAAQYRAFFDFRARKLIAKIYHGNLRSKLTVQSCGFREEERLEKLSRYSITMDEYLDFLEQKRA